MDIISLLITIAGILIILALYIMGRVSQSKMPRERPIDSLPKIMDDDGKPFTSVLDDIPATDGSPPNPEPISQETPADPVSKTSQAKSTVTGNSASHAALKTTANAKDTQTGKAETTASPQSQTQHILFISSSDSKGLDGNKIDTVLKQNGLSFGDMDIYHYPVNINQSSDNGIVDLFRIAKGVSPWTLRPKDLKNQTIPGLSLLMITPAPIDDRQAIGLFIDTAKRIADGLGGILKNSKQQVFTDKDKDDLLMSL